MRLFYIRDGILYKSIEFNGDGYCTRPDDNGWIGLSALVKFEPGVDVEQDYAALVGKFNSETYGYDECLYGTDSASPNRLAEIIEHCYTDYIYIRNDDAPFDMILNGNAVTVGKYTVINFDEPYSDENIERCIAAAMAS